VLPNAQVTGIQTGLQGVADQPVKKKKKRKKASAGGNESSHLSKGSMEMTGTAVEPTRAAIAAQHEATEQASSPTRSRARASFESDSSAGYVEQPEQAKTRVGAALARQPSMIDEAPEYEQAPERANTGKKVESLTPKTPVNGSRRGGAVSPEPAPAAQSAPPPSFEPDGASVHRTTSLSPSRSTHFSPKPEYLGGIQHQPLGRSASPAKSALKHSPSSSVRTASPDVRFSAPSSEVGMSDSVGSLSKKKSNRVSFDEKPIIVSGLQTSRYASQSPDRSRGVDDDLEDIMKPRPALPSFGSVRGRKEESAEPHAITTSKPVGHSSDHMVGGILAQDFASRGMVHDPTMPLAPEVTSVEGTGYASDSGSEYSEHTTHTQTHQVEQPSTLDKEPETIAEAVSAFQSHDQVTNERQNGAAQKSVAEPLLPAAEEPQQVVAAPPTIAVLPATPAAEEEKKELVMPGSFPGAWDDDVEEQPVSQTAKDMTSPAVTFAQPSQSQSSASTHGVLAALRAQEESDSESDTSSIWSDAEEDFPSGPEGFASLNAILDSPQPAPAPGLVNSKHAPSADNAPPSPTAAHWDQATAYWRGLSEQKKKELEQQALRKEQGIVESETESGSEEETSEDEELESSPPRPAIPPQKQVRQKPQLESPIAFAASKAQPAPKTKQEPKLRSSMRSSTISTDGDDEAPRIRKSMRGSMRDNSTEKPRASGEHHFRSSMRGAQPPRPDPVRRHSSGLDESRYAQPARPAAAKASEIVQNGRPRSASGGAAPTKSALKKSVAQAPPVPTLRRQDSDDSVSSFRRQRISSPGRMSMRMSMRGPSPAAAPVEQRPQSPPEKKKGGLFRLRSLSPSGRKPPPEVQASQIRNSLRPGSSAGAPTLRKHEPQSPPKKASRLKSPTRLGFGRSKDKVEDSPRGKSVPVVASPPRKSRISADSDDEDVPRANFVSRFADSDDEPDSPQQTTKALTPVRGIPRRDTDGDSTDLDDSDNERTKKIPPVPTMRDIDHAHGKKSPRVTNGNKAPSILSAGSLRKGSTGGEVSGLNSSRFAAPAAPASPTPAERPQHKRRLSWLSMSGKSKRSSSMPPPITSPPPSRGNDAPPMPGKPNLLRRSTPTGLPQISEDSNWPLASPSGVGEDTRPSTADGPGTAFRKGTMRPDVGQRRSTADYPGTGRITTTIEGGAGVGDGGSVVEGGRKRVGFNFESGEPVYSERTGKKKKFGGLRRMFGLHD